MDTERTEAIQAVVDRLTSYQESAPAGTVQRELRSALNETGLDLSDDEVHRLVAAIEKTDEPVDVVGTLS